MAATANPIQGLYLTGADVCSAGVAGALFGGVLTVSSILLRDMVGACAKRAKRLTNATQSTAKAPAGRANAA